ncbi:MAG: hypothetical protein QMC80_07905 [Thermoplasmatales archaeon]|nr:hypothetical protein [Thermoplasmatales archaeon]
MCKNSLYFYHFSKYLLISTLFKILEKIDYFDLLIALNIFKKIGAEKRVEKTGEVLNKT